MPLSLSSLKWGPLITMLTLSTASHRVMFCHARWLRTFQFLFLIIVFWVLFRSVGSFALIWRRKKKFSALFVCRSNDSQKKCFFFVCFFLSISKECTSRSIFFVCTNVDVSIHRGALRNFYYIEPSSGDGSCSRWLNWVVTDFMLIFIHQEQTIWSFLNWYNYMSPSTRELEVWNNGSLRSNN